MQAITYELLTKYGFQKVIGKHPTIAYKPYDIYILRLDSAIYLEYDNILKFASLVRFKANKKIEVMIPKKINTEQELKKLLNVIK